MHDRHARGLHDMVIGQDLHMGGDQHVIADRDATLAAYDSRSPTMQRAPIVMPAWGRSRKLYTCRIAPCMMMVSSPMAMPPGQACR